MAGALGAWNSLKDHQPGARDDLSGPLPFGQSDNNCRSDDEGSRPFIGNIFIFIYTLHVGHMGDRGLKGHFGWWKLAMKPPTCRRN
jgi:hypothetical protein